MNLICSRRFLTKCTRLGKFCIASVFMLCSFSVSARADEWSALDSLTLQSIESLLFQANLIAVNGITNSLVSIDQTLEDWRMQWQDDFWLGPISSATSRYNWQQYLAAQTYLLGGVDGLDSADRSRASDALQSIGLNYGKARTNSIPYYLREILKSTKRSQDVLAGNPWWATNSAFVVSFENRNYAFPPDGEANAGKFSFPEFLSAWSSRLSSPYSRQSDQRLLDRDNWWGVSAFNPSASVADNIIRSYTWFDYVADWFKSNNAVDLSMRYSSSTGALLAELESQGYDSSVDTPTNSPLPEYFDPFREVEYIGSRVAQKGVPGRNLINIRVLALSRMVDGSTDPTITVIPEFTVGGIHVPKYTASLDTPITSAVHALMFFLYYVGLFAGLFDLAQTEFGFYANLGRTWTVSRGVPNH